MQEQKQSDFNWAPLLLRDCLQHRGHQVASSDTSGQVLQPDQIRLDSGHSNKILQHRT